MKNNIAHLITGYQVRAKKGSKDSGRIEGIRRNAEARKERKRIRKQYPKSKI